MSLIIGPLQTAEAGLEAQRLVDGGYIGSPVASTPGRICVGRHIATPRHLVTTYESTSQRE